MGDFDRNQIPNAKKDETKKFVVMIILAAGFVGYLGFRYVRNDSGPQTTNGAMASSGFVASSSTDESPEQIKNALLQDPTNTNNVLKGFTDDTSLNVVPRNPFRMNRAWKDSLIKTVDPAPVSPIQQVNPTPQVERDPPRPAYVAKTLKADDYKLGIIMRGGGGPLAIVNGQSVSAGMIIKDALVVSVTDDAVTLRHKDEPNGATIELRMSPGK